MVQAHLDSTARATTTQQAAAAVASPLEIQVAPPLPPPDILPSTTISLRRPVFNPVPFTDPRPGRKTRTPFFGKAIQELRESTELRDKRSSPRQMHPSAFEDDAERKRSPSSSLSLSLSHHHHRRRPPPSLHNRTHSRIGVVEPLCIPT